MMGIFADIQKVLSELGLSAVQAERLALLKDRLDAIEEEHSKLRDKNTDLEKCCRELEKELQAKTVPDEFTENCGVLLRKTPAGDYGPTAYCVHCKSPMFSLMDRTPFKCSKCGYVAPVTGLDIGMLIKEIKCRG